MELLERTFGIEMEWAFSKYRTDTMVAALRNQEFKVNSNDQHDSWSVTCDGGDYGLEVRTPVSTWKNWNEIKEVTKFLRSVGDGYDRSCGMHCHFGISDLSRPQIMDWAALWAALEAGIFMLVHRHRRDNMWCRSVNEQLTWPEIKQQLLEQRNWMYIIDYYRRYSLNPHSRWGTSEVRLHQASLDPIKQRGWILMVQVLLNHVVKAELTAAQIIELYALTPVKKVEWIQQLVTDHLDSARAVWLRKHIAWRAKRYSDVEIAA